MLKSPLSALVLASLLASSGFSIANAADANNCSSSFYCYGSDATPAGATPVRVVVEGANNQGTLIENVRRAVVTAPARPLPPVRPTVNNRLVRVSPAASRPVVVSPVINNLVTRPAILDANLQPAPPVRRVVISPTPRVQPTTTRPTLATRPTRRVTVTSNTSITSITSCNTLIGRAVKAESQGVVFAKSGQSTLSRQSFQTAAGLRTQAKNLNCSV